MKPENPFIAEDLIVSSTLHGTLLTAYRRDGNTTRQIDRAIHIIMQGNVCHVEDHHEGGKHKEANKRLFNMILKRISEEHFREVPYIRFSKNGPLYIKLLSDSQS